VSLNAPHNNAIFNLLLVTMMHRHGESVGNRDNRFIGWGDVPLTPHGADEAVAAAHTIAEHGFEVDEIFCSYLKRSIKSSWIMADTFDKSYMPVHARWRLNEQMYGALQGLGKRDTAAKYGIELVQKWRRSYGKCVTTVQRTHHQHMSLVLVHVCRRSCMSAHASFVDKH
jgi:bisphosphoglycerate-dependent phosphoglycerate mutase family 1